MSLVTILVVLFASISVVAYFCMSSTTDALDHYSSRLSNTAESRLRTLFLFADARKLLIVYIAALLLVPILLILAGAGVIVTGLGVLLLILFPRLMFARLATRRKTKINAALPDALTQVAGAMRAGSTFSMSLQSFVDEHKGPLGQEFSLMLRELRLGARLEDALDNLAERVQTEEMDLVVSAALIANDIGGNLAEILQSLADTIRRKLEMEGKVGALTAQGRLQGYVVSALPFLILLPLVKYEPEATLPLFHTLLGWVFLAVIIILEVIGGLMIRKIVDVDI